MSNENTLNSKTCIEGINFEWQIENGRFLFEKDDAVLFWISTAMKSFFDTLEEVAGQDASDVVLETTGFRQGLVVGTYFKSLNKSLSEIADNLTLIYGSAGWGYFTITQIDKETTTATLRLKDSWEYKINREQEKEKSGNFLPGHFAGLLTGLFETNMGYRILNDQLNGHDFTEIEFFPSIKTVENNIHDLARRKQALQIQHLEEAVEKRTRELNELVNELSSPIIPVLDGIVVVPLLGKYDEIRSEVVIQKTLTNLPKLQVDYLVLDLTGLSKNICSYTVEFLNKLASAASLIGTKTILVGISPELGIAISSTNFELSKFNCFTNLQHGIYYALSQQGRQIL
ncbi:STAS domain-containing protein [Bacillus sp. 31A1R]|uniref:STAS domain-containing protein n=1 Tax=Robertmurraya mangrovi TaxID=3098077 RepID=A0ABU5J3U0_9BACI|nr:STAS domain-containing protein [Bacillus sp. 31A1R]MDZ5474007.1 STAS domain-containing protein [Bacillus sp. 31A1R]